jgi:hypothetical protein
MQGAGYYAARFSAPICPAPTDQGDREMVDQEFPDEAIGDMENVETGAAVGPFPGFPLFPAASGLYMRSISIWPQPLPIIPQPIPRPIPIGGAQQKEEQTAAEVNETGLFPWFESEELRVDVDGRYPQMTVSGTIRHGIAVRIDWIASVARVGTNVYSGDIWYKDGSTAFLPQTNVAINVVRSWFSNQRQVTATFTGGGATKRVRVYRWKSWYFHPVELEFDCVENATATTVINTCDHPNRPAGLTCENLSAQTVYRRAGFDVRTSPGGNVVPITGAGPNATWSDAEMHDAMQTFWSNWADSAQWSLWTFFARQHDMGPGLGGIMFDDIGPNHRQGTAIFNDSFISNAPTGDQNPNAWIRRMRFWTAIHEMGHAFNLAHSWQKALGTPWIPLMNDPEARSFMNYPFRVSGGQSQFFSDFEYSFTDQELLFMRHAPARFVQMGNADWFDHHGFEQARRSPESPFVLEARVHRDVTDYHQFLEPVSVELKLKNISGEPQIIARNILAETDQMVVILKKQGKPARRWAPYANRCYEQAKLALQPGEAVYGSVLVSSGLNGWDLAEPGIYSVQVSLQMGDEDIVSNPLRIQIAPPEDRQEELLAQDYFSDEVGRILAFDGSQYFERANDVLREVAAKLPDRNVALSARLAVAIPRAHAYKTLNLDKDSMKRRAEDKAIGAFKVVKADAKMAREEMTAVLQTDAAKAADTLGHIDYKVRVDMLSHFLAEGGDVTAAADCQENMHELLEKRGVLKSVLNQIDKAKAQYARAKPSAA